MTQNHTEEVLIIPRLGTAQRGRHGVPGVEALSAAGKRGKRYERGAPGFLAGECVQIFENFIFGVSRGGMCKNF